MGSIDDISVTNTAHIIEREPVTNIFFTHTRLAEHRVTPHNAWAQNSRLLQSYAQYHVFSRLAQIQLVEGQVIIMKCFLLEGNDTCIFRLHFIG